MSCFALAAASRWVIPIPESSWPSDTAFTRRVHSEGVSRAEGGEALTSCSPTSATAFMPEEKNIFGLLMITESATCGRDLIIFAEIEDSSIRQSS